VFGQRGHYQITIDPAAARGQAFGRYAKVGLRAVGVMRQDGRGAMTVSPDGRLMGECPPPMREGRRGRSPIWLMGGWEMANRRSTTRAPRSRSAPQVISPRNRTNVALPLSFSRFTTEEPAMTVSDLISLAGLVVSVIGFSVVIWQFTRAANAREEHQASHRAA
jgi:hypothetical protein